MSVGKKQLSLSKLAVLYSNVSHFIIPILLSSGLAFPVSLGVPMELQPGNERDCALQRLCKHVVSKLGCLHVTAK
jgi:hypothetical protein